MLKALAIIAVTTVVTFGLRYAALCSTSPQRGLMKGQADLVGHCPYLQLQMTRSSDLAPR